MSRGGETPMQRLARLLDEALEALAEAPDHLVTRSGYCAKCEGSCDKASWATPAEFVAHPWDQVIERDRNAEAARQFRRIQTITNEPERPQ